MKLATFNVNSLKMRLPVVQDWLAAHAPDFLMLQELKSLDLPEDAIKATGYHLSAVPQKAYNGVAILSKQPVSVLYTRLPGMEDDEQARYLEVLVNPLPSRERENAKQQSDGTRTETPAQAGVHSPTNPEKRHHGSLLPQGLQLSSPSRGEGIHLINIYAPNGNPVESEKFTYKLKWLEALYERLKTLRHESRDVVITGDFNIIPENIDAAHPEKWVNDALFQPQSRALYRAMLHLGYSDALRALDPYNPDLYSFWDYQAGAWPRNDGIRIDHFLLSPRLADALTRAEVDRYPRAGDKPSDHTPVWVEINI